MSAEAGLLSIDNVIAGYGSKRVLQDVSLSIDNKEIVGLLGLNGAGKTTLIKTIVQLKECESGEVMSAGGSQGLYNTKKLFSYLPERFDPPSFLTAYEFLKFSLKLYGLPVNREVVNNTALKLGLDPDVLDRRVHSFSKGMRQKLGIMATILPECPLLILDEPMSGLDPRARKQVKSMLQNYKAQGHSVFLSSHILSDAVEICDRVMVLEGGRLLFQGKIDAFLKNDKDNNPEQAFLNLVESHSKQ